MKTGKPLKLDIMKTIIKAISASALIAFAGCSTENTTAEVQDQQTRNIIVNAGPVKTKLVFDENDSNVEVSWAESGETFAAYIGDSQTAPIVIFEQISAPDEFGNVKFKGEIPAETPEDAMIYAIYPGDIASGTGNPAAVNLMLNTQPGALNSEKTFMYASASIADLGNETKSLKFTHLASVVKLTLDFGAAATGSVKDVVLHANKLMRSANVDLTTGTISQGTVSRLKMTDEYALENGKATIYFYVLPNAIDDIVIRAKVGETLYVGELAGKTVESGKVYKVGASVTMEERNDKLQGYTGAVLAMQKYTQNTAYHFLNAETKTRYTASTGPDNSASVDVVAFFSSTDNCCLAAPNTSNTNTIYKTASWATRNVTTFHIIRAADVEASGIVYDDITKHSQLEPFVKAYMDDASYRAMKVAVGDLILFQTTDGKIGIMKIATVAGNNSGLMKFDYKVSK